MSDFKVAVSWQRQTPDFEPKTYDRTHTVRVGGGFSYQASSAPEFAGKAELPNPEEAFLAALSSCHMLTFLAIAANSKFVVDAYEDTVVATLEKTEKGRPCLKRVLLRPTVRFSPDAAPSAEMLKKLHEKAHANCIVANSLAAAVEVAVS